MKKLISVLCYGAAIFIIYGTLIYTCFVFRATLLQGQGVGSMSGLAFAFALVSSFPLWFFARIIVNIRALSHSYWAGVFIVLLFVMAVPSWFANPR